MDRVVETVFAGRRPHRGGAIAERGAVPVPPRPFWMLTVRCRPRRDRASRTVLVAVLITTQIVTEVGDIDFFAVRSDRHAHGTPEPGTGTVAITGIAGTVWSLVT